jgi:hypothetical protein
MVAATAAGIYRSAMFSRMNGIAGHIFQESHDKAAVAGRTCMHIEPYDTETVP